MEVFRELVIRATEAQMAELATHIESAATAGWVRDRIAEEKARQSPIARKPLYCFRCLAEGERAAALVLLSQKDTTSFAVSNIVPVSTYQLSHREYNRVLEDFDERLLRPIASQAGLDVAISEANVNLEHWMPSAVAEKLRCFSSNANRGTGSSHPNDRQRWNDFVLSAHRERSSLDAATLQRWLVEVEGWPIDVADQLAVEYDYGRELLNFVEGHRRSA